MDELKLSACEVRDAIVKSNSLDFSIKEVRKIQKDVGQPEIFEMHVITEAVKSEVKWANDQALSTIKYKADGTLKEAKLWSYERLPQTAAGEFFTYKCLYEYNKNDTYILSQRDHVRMWAHTAFLSAARLQMRLLNAHV